MARPKKIAAAVETPETEVTEAPKAEGNIYAATNVGAKFVILEQPDGGVVAYITRREYEDLRATGKVITYQNEQYVDADPTTIRFPERFADKLVGISDKQLERLLYKSNIFSLHDLDNKAVMGGFYQNVIAAAASRIKTLK